MPIDALGNQVGEDEGLQDVPVGVSAGGLSAPTTVPEIIQEAYTPPAPQPPAGSSWFTSLFSRPEPQPGDPDYSAPVPRGPPPITDLNQRPFTQEEIDAAADTPGFFHTIGEEVGTLKGLTQKIPWFGHLPESTKTVQVYLASRRLQEGSYVNPDEEQRDLRDVIGFFNETRIRQKTDENRSFWGKAVQIPLRSIPFGMEIALSQMIGRRKGLDPKKLAALTGIEVADAAEMTGVRLGYIKLLNQWIGEGGEKLIQDRLKAYATKYGNDEMRKLVAEGSTEVQKLWMKEAREGLAKNILARQAGETVLSNRQLLGAARSQLEVNVAEELLKKHASLKFASRALEIGTLLPIVNTGGVIAAGPARAMNRMGISQSEDGKITINSSGESLPESVLKGLTSEYLEYITEFSGPTIQNALKQGVFRHLSSLKLADLASRLPGGAPIVNKLGVIMDSTPVKRGMTTAARIMNRASRRLLIQDPLSEYGEEVINAAASSLFNLDDDGKTPWATRVFKNLLHPVFYPKEAAAMMAGFTFLPVGAFAAGTAFGQLTDTEQQRNRELVDAIASPARHYMFRDSDEISSIVVPLYQTMMAEHAKKIDSSWLGQMLETSFGWKNASLRPGAAFSNVYERLGGWRSADELRDRLLKDTPEKAQAFLAALLTTQTNQKFLDNLESDPQRKADFGLLNGLAADQENLANLVAPYAKVPLEGRDILAGTAIRATPEEVTATGLRDKAVVGNLSMPRLESLLAGAKEALAIAPTPEQRAELEKQIVKLEANITRIKTPEFVKTAGPYLRILSGDLDADEAAGVGAFAGRLRLTPDHFTASENYPSIRRWASLGHFSGLKKTLGAILADPKAREDKEYYYVPGAGMEAEVEKFIERGYDVSKLGQKIMYGFVVRGEKGQKDRVYFTNDATPLDVIHEAAHGDEKKERILAHVIADSLLKARTKGAAVEETEGLPKDLFDYIRLNMPQLKSGDRTGQGGAPKKGENKMGVEEYLERIRSGSIRNAKFMEDAANLVALHMGYGRDMNRPELRGARLMFDTLKSSEWFRYGIESLIRRKEERTLSLPELHLHPRTEEQWKDLQARFTPAEKRQQDKKEEAAKVPKGKEVEVELEGEGEIEVEEEPKATKPSKPGQTKPPEEVPQAKKPPKAKEAAKSKHEGTEELGGTAPRKAPGRLSMGDEFADVKDRDVLRVARILSVSAAAKLITLNYKNGDPDWVDLAAQLRNTGLADLALPEELRKAYRLLRAEQTPYLVSILTEPADAWQSELLDALANARDVKKLAKKTAHQEAVAALATKAGISTKEADARIRFTEQARADYLAELEVQQERDQDSVTATPDAALPDVALYASDETLSKSLWTRPDTLRFFDLMDLSAGVDLQPLQLGTRWFPSLLHQLSGKQHLLREVFAKALLSQDNYKEAVTRPQKFLKDVAGETVIPKRVQMVWENMLAPTLRGHTYLEMNNPFQEISLGAVLMSTSLSPVLGLNIQADGTVELDLLNASRHSLNKATTYALTVLDKMFLKAREGDSSRVWEAWVRRTLGKLPMFKSALYGESGMKGKLARRILQESKDYGAMLDIVNMFFPPEEMGVSDKLLRRIISSKNFGRNARSAVRNFVYQVLNNTLPGIPAAKANGLMRTALFGGGKKFGLIRNLYQPILQSSPRNLSTMANRYGAMKEARRNSWLLELLNTSENVEHLKSIGVLGAKDQENLDIQFLNYGRRDNGEARRATITDSNEWTGEDRREIPYHLLRAVETAADGTKTFFFAMSPMGNKTVIPLLRVRYFEPAELSAAYAKALTWLEKNGGTKNVVSQEDFDKRYAKSADGNLVLYAAVVMRMVNGSYESYQKGALSYIKYSSQTLAGGPSMLAVDHDLVGDYNVLLIKNLPTVPTEEGMVPVLPAAGSSLKPTAWADGMDFLTDEGARIHHTDSAKGLGTWVTKDFRRGLLKSDSLHLTEDLLRDATPALKHLFIWVNQYNKLHPDSPIHRVSVEANAKVLDAKAATVFPVLSWNKDTKEMEFNEAMANKSALWRIPLRGMHTVSNLKAPTKPRMVTLASQLQDAVNLDGGNNILRKFILFPAARQFQAELPRLSGPFEEFRDNLMNVYLRDGIEKEDEALIARLEAGEDIRLDPAFFERMEIMVYSKLRRVEPKLFGLRNISIENFFAKGLVPETPNYLNDNGDRLTGADLQSATEVIVEPADLIANIDGAREDQELDTTSSNPDKEAAILDYLWGNRAEWPDIFQSVLVRGERPYIQLVKKLMPDVKRDLNVSTKEVQKGTWRYDFRLRGELLIDNRTPSSGAECTTLYRMKRNLGLHKDANIPGYNYRVVEGRVVLYAGEDFDGDWRLTYMVAKDEKGRPRGHVAHKNGALDDADRIQLTPPEGVRWTEEATATVAFQYLARGMSYLSESPRYFNPALHIDPLHRVLTAGLYEGIAEAPQKVVLDEAAVGWNSLESYLRGTQITGDLNAMAVAVRARTTALFLLENYITPIRDLNIQIDGIDHTFTWKAGERVSPAREGLLRSASGTIMGLVMDSIKDFYAPSLNLTQDLLGLTYSVLLANKNLVREGKLKANETQAEMLESVVGTIELLNKKLFSETGKALLHQLGFSGDKLLPLAPRNYDLLVDNPGLRDLIDLATTFRRTGGWFDIYHHVSRDNAGGFLDLSNGDRGIESTTGKKAFPERFVFRPEDLMKTVQFQRSSEVLTRALDILPQLPVDLLNHETLAKGVLGNQDFKDEYAEILDSKIWGNLDNQFLPLLSAQARQQVAETYQRSRRKGAGAPKVEKSGEQEVDMSEDNGEVTAEEIPSVASVGREQGRTIPVISRTAMERTNAFDLASEFEKLPVSHQRALAINALEMWGLEHSMYSGSYADMLPASIRIWLLQEMAKVSPEIKQALGAQPAAAEGKGKPVAQTPDTNVSPSAALVLASPTRVLAKGFAGEVTLDISKTASFTGHRPNKLGGYSKDNPLAKKVIQSLEVEIRKAVSRGYNTFISGMALGVDQWAAEIVLRLKSEFPRIRLVAAVPFRGQESVWKDPKAVASYKTLLLKSDAVIEVSSPGYTETKMQVRNVWMANHSNMLIAVWDGSSGGTANAVRYALNGGHENAIGVRGSIVNYVRINPETLVKKTPAPVTPAPVLAPVAVPPVTAAPVAVAPVITGPRTIVFNEKQKRASEVTTKWMMGLEGYQGPGAKPVRYAHNTAILSGYAGTGKTTIVGRIVLQVLPGFGGPRNVLFSAPTHAATSVLSEALVQSNLPVKAVTMQALLGLRPSADLENFDPRQKKFQVNERFIKMPSGGLVIVDEASMVNKTLFALLVKLAKARRTGVLFTGDSAQLPPIGEEKTISMALLEANADAYSQLTEIMRTKANNPLLRMATAVRNALGAPVGSQSPQESSWSQEGEGIIYTRDRGYFIQKWAELLQSAQGLDPFERGRYTRMVAGTNKAVNAWNVIGRKILGLDKISPYLAEGDILVGYKSVQLNKEDMIKNAFYYQTMEVSEPITPRDSNGIAYHEVVLQSLSSRSDGELVVRVPVAGAGERAYAKRWTLLLRELLAATGTGRGKEAHDAFEDFSDSYQLVRDFETTTGVIPKTLGFGLSVTAHKAQGSGITYPLVDFGSILNFGSVHGSSAETRNRMWYTALTRSILGAVVLSPNAKTPTESQPKVTFAKMTSPAAPVPQAPVASPAPATPVSEDIWEENVQNVKFEDVSPEAFDALSRPAQAEKVEEALHDFDEGEVGEGEEIDLPGDEVDVDDGPVDPVSSGSLGEMELTYKIGSQLDPKNSLHAELKKRFTFVERMVNNGRLDIHRLLKSSGEGRHEIPILHALSYYLDSGDVDTKVRLVSNVRKVLKMEYDYEIEEMKLVSSYDDSLAPTVKEVVKEYELLRAAHPEYKLAPFKGSPDSLVGQGPKIFQRARFELNQHASEFTDSPELFSDITSRINTEYIPHVTTSPFGKSMGEQVSAAITTLLASGTLDEIVINPAGAQEIITTRKVNANQAAVNALAFKEFRGLPPEQKQRVIAGMISNAKRIWEQDNDRQESLITELTHRTERRKGDLNLTFQNTGRVLRHPNFADSAMHYIRETSDFAASKRYLSYMANLTDYLGTPTVFFMAVRNPSSEDTQRLLSRTTAQTLFNNWRARLLADGVKAEPYNMSKSVWDNLQDLENLATSEKTDKDAKDAKGPKGWFETHGYKRVTLKNMKGFSHAWVLKGDAEKLLEHATSRGIEDWENTGLHGVIKKIFQKLIWFNQLTKQLALSFSLFHSAALLESQLAGHGMVRTNPILNPWRLYTEIRDTIRFAKKAVSDPAIRETLSLWMNSGLTFRFSDRDPLSDPIEGEGGPLDKYLDQGTAWAMANPVAKATLGPGLLAARWFKRSTDHLLWEVQQPAAKLMMADRLYSATLQNPEYAFWAETPSGREQIRQEVAQLVNQTFGGINWHDMIWATPMMRDIMRALIFAPDWTFANLQAAMVPDLLQKVTGVKMPFGPDARMNIRTKFLAEHYWPTTVFLVLMLVPSVWQGLIYYSVGDPDEGDTPFMWMNEEGKERSIDVSALYRKLGEKFGITKRRRVYIQWGKQAYEIGGWFNAPWKTFLGKTSMGVKAFWENATGRNTAGWDMPWAKDGASAPFGGLFLVNGKLSESRMSYVAQKFVPMTWLNLLSGDKPATFFAPAGLGMNSYNAERQIADVLQAYGDDNIWYQLKGKPEKVKRLETLVEATLAAAYMNGYEVKDILSTAKGMAHARQTAEFFAELEKNPEKPNLAKLEKIAREAQRTDQAYKNLRTALKNKYAKEARRMPLRQQTALQQAWQSAREKRGENP